MYIFYFFILKINSKDSDFFNPRHSPLSQGISTKGKFFNGKDTATSSIRLRKSNNSRLAKSKSNKSKVSKIMIKSKSTNVFKKVTFNNEPEIILFSDLEEFKKNRKNTKCIIF